MQNSSERAGEMAWHSIVLLLLQRAGSSVPSTHTACIFSSQGIRVPHPHSRSYTLPPYTYLYLKIIKTSFTNIVLAEENKHFSKRLETGGSGWSPDVGNRRMPGNPAY